MSKTAVYIHLVFATKHREATLIPQMRARLYDYIIGIFRKKDCYVYAINGVADHIHVCFDLHPTVALSSLVREVKSVSSSWIKEDKVISVFNGWNDGYYAGSISPAHRDACVDYIRRQESHHAGSGFEMEMKKMASKYGLVYHPKDWD